MMFEANLCKLKLGAAAIAAAVSMPLTAADWQRPDCSAFDSESECVHSVRNKYRQQKQQALKEKGLSFWYYARPDFSDDEAVEKAIKDKLEGQVTIIFDVAKDGSTESVALKNLSSEDMRVYTPALLEAVKEWQFIGPDSPVRGEQWDFTFMFAKSSCTDDEDECEADAKDVDDR